jgi:ubiquinone/menaquinone biosynthesis C-methylase UbiE
VRQADLPRGLAGRLAGAIMGWLNADMEHRAVEQLRLAGDQQVLEVGFGSGVGIALLVKRVGAANVAGVEPSAVMIEQARARLPPEARDVVTLVEGTAGRIPFLDDSFDAVVSVNNVQLWRLPEDLLEVARVLRPGGRLSIAVHGWVVQRPARAGLERLCARLGDARFTVEAASVGRSRTGQALYLVARSA